MNTGAWVALDDPSIGGATGEDMRIIEVAPEPPRGHK